MIYQIKLKPNLPFANCPTLCELEGDNIVCNDVNLPKEIDSYNSYNPHNVRAWVIGHEFGAICMIFASHEQDAFDAAVDANQLDSLLDTDQDHQNESLTSLGNAGELFDLSNVWISEVEFDPARDIHLIVGLVRSGALGNDTLG